MRRNKMSIPVKFSATTFLRSLADIPWLAPLLIAILGLLAYANSFPGNYFLDDHTAIFDNPLIANFDVGRIFLTDYWGPDFNSGLYRPLVILSFALKQALLGPAPWGDHLINVVLHVLVSCLAFRTLCRWEVSAPIAFLTASLFAVHPIHTEVLNEAVGRSELLAALGLLIALYCSRSQGYRSYLGVAGGFLLGGLSKESAIALAGFLPLLDFFRAESFSAVWRRRRNLYLMLIGLILAWLAFRTWGVQHWTPVGGLDQVYTPLPFMEPLERFLVALQIQWLYLYKLLVPVSLQAIYSGDGFYFPQKSIWTFPGIWLVILSAGLLVAAGWLYWRGQRIALALLLYAVAFAPTSNLFILTGVTMAERLAYVPSLWFCFGLSVALFAAAERLGPRYLVIVSVFLLTSFAGLTLNRNRDFVDELHLWQADTRTDPQNVMAWMFLAGQYWSHEENRQAEEAFIRMAQLKPDFGVGLSAYAGFLRAQKRPNEALPLALRAQKDRGNNAPDLNLTTTHIYLDLGDFVEARRWLEKGRWISGKTDYFIALEGQILECEGDPEGALANYRRINVALPEWRVHERMAAILLKKEGFAEAVEVLRLALQSHETGEKWNSLGIALAQQGLIAEARSAFLKAMTMSPDIHGYRDNFETVRHK